jgi:prepilin-type N-terminal cleavage/methylation domain-containing protein
MLKQKSAFTLIELLVVIAIIGLLSTLSVVALSNARARARDATRLSDVKQIQSALNLYWQAAGVYPDNIVTGDPIEYDDGSQVNIFLDAVPTPPQPSDDGPCDTYTDYSYSTSSAEGSMLYTLTYCLGNSTSDLPSGPGTATPFGIRE